MRACGLTCEYETRCRVSRGGRSTAVTAPQPIPFFSAVADFASGKNTPRDFLEGAAGCLTVPRCVSSYKIAQPDVSTDRLHVRMPGFR
jgi:hypothetical protein